MKGSIKMKKYLNISFVYAIAAMAGGVFTGSSQNGTALKA